MAGRSLQLRDHPLRFEIRHRLTFEFLIKSDDLAI
jgi:hypothetical protein